VLSASNLAFKGKSRKLTSSRVVILTVCWLCRAFGVIPIFLSEISPPAFRSTFAGVTYQFGTMASAASAQIEASGCLSFSGWAGLTHIIRFVAAGEHSRTTIRGKDVPNYALVQGIFIGCVAAYVIILTLIGPENHGSHFEKSKTAFQAGASREDVSFIPAEFGEAEDVGRQSIGSEKEKEMIQHV